VEMDLIQDYYGSPAVNFEDDTQENLPGDTPTPADNAQATFFELPAELTEGNIPQVVPLRIRDNANAFSEQIHLSPDGVTYQLSESDGFVHTGGVLTSALVLDTDYNLDEGPTFTVEGEDIADVVEDYSADATSWREGRQVALIGDELFFVAKVTALGGSSYRLDGLLRARYDTQRALHAIGAVVYLFPADQVLPVSDSLIQPNVALYMKQQAMFNGAAVALGSVTAVTKTVKAKGLVPSRPAALRVVAPFMKVPGYQTGDDVSFRWAYRSTAYPGTGAGQQRTNNQAVGESPVQGRFEVKIYNSGAALVRTELVDDPEWTYTNADLASDLGGEFDFTIEVRNVNGGWKSDPVTLDVVAI
jgi:hypothetical protein